MLKNLAAAAVVALSAGTALATPTLELSFVRVAPANSPVNPASQLKCVVSEFSSSIVSFKFTNNVGIVSSVSEIYYTDGPFDGAATLVQFGTEFVAGSASPGNLPGGGGLTPPFIATSIFSADAQGNPSKGIDTAADWLEMRFDLDSGKSFQDVLDALYTGDLRVGLHVRSIGAGGDSDAFVNEPVLPPPVVPLPPAVWTGLASIAGIGLVRTIRRRNAR